MRHGFRVANCATLKSSQCGHSSSGTIWYLSLLCDLMTPRPACLHRIHYWLSSGPLAGLPQTAGEGGSCLAVPGRRYEYAYISYACIWRRGGECLTRDDTHRICRDDRVGTAQAWSVISPHQIFPQCGTMIWRLRRVEHKTTAEGEPLFCDDAISCEKARRGQPLYAGKRIYSIPEM